MKTTLVSTDVKTSVTFDGQDINEFHQEIVDIAHGALFDKSILMDNSFEDSDDNPVTMEILKSCIEKLECALYDILDKFGD